MPYLVLQLFHFQFLFSDLPSSAIEMFFFTNELSSYTYNMPTMLEFVFQFFALRSLLIMPLCVYVFLFCVAVSP